MFQQLDIVIAFAMIMLLLSLLVTVFVQMVVAVLGLRGSNLLWGLEQLLEQVAPKLAAKANKGTARAIVKQILGHKILATSTNWLMKGLDWVVGKLTGKPGRFNGGKRPPTAVQSSVVQLVMATVFSQEEPLETLKKQFPEHQELLTEVVEEMRDKKDELAARFEEWFDVVMDATSERFKLWSRWVTVVGALLLAFGLRVDSTDILKQLSSSPEIRVELLKQVPEAQEMYEQLQGKGTGDEKKRVEDLGATLGVLKEELERSELVVMRPFKSWDELRNQFEIGTSDQFWGMLVTALLLSLGAPFWYGTLSKLVGFRSAVTSKNDRQADPVAGG